MTQKNVFCGQKVLKNIYNDIGINDMSVHYWIIKLQYTIVH